MNHASHQLDQRHQQDTSLLGTSRYRHALPQLNGHTLVTDGGMETTLIYHEGIDLPAFASFTLLDNDSGRTTLRNYYQRYFDIARHYRRGLLLEAPTWRANRDWGAQLGYDGAALADINRRAIALMVQLRADNRDVAPVVISGNLGPRGDGYIADKQMSVREAGDYHGEQIATFADTAADLIAAFTINYVEEAIGIINAARAHRMPVVISFTLETDGRLPSGQSLGAAIAECDAATGGYAAYYMINCAHPTHFDQVLPAEAPWLARIRGLRANASKRSHAELDAATELDAGDPVDLGQRYRALRPLLPNLSVVGGCCGTDHRHVEQICNALAGNGRN